MKKLLLIGVLGWVLWWQGGWPNYQWMVAGVFSDQFTCQRYRTGIMGKAVCLPEGIYPMGFGG